MLSAYFEGKSSLLRDLLRVPAELFRFVDSRNIIGLSRGAYMCMMYDICRVYWLIIEQTFGDQFKCESGLIKQMS